MAIKVEKQWLWKSQNGKENNENINDAAKKNDSDESKEENNDPSGSDKIDLLRKIFQRSLDEIEKTNLIDSFCKESGLTLDNLNKFINSHNTPDSVNSGEVVPKLVKSFDSLLDDLLETDEEEGHGSESLMQDSSSESNDCG